MTVVKVAYEKPVLTKHDGLRDITFTCPKWQCSFDIPPED